MHCVSTILIISNFYSQIQFPSQNKKSQLDKNQIGLTLIIIYINYQTKNSTNTWANNIRKNIVSGYTVA